MSKWWLVAKREFLFNVRRSSFLFATFGAPLLLGIVMFIVFSLIASSFTAELTDAIGYVDQSGVLAEGVERPETFVPYASEEEASAALTAGELKGYFVVPEDYLESGSVDFYRGGDVAPTVENVIEEYLLANLGAQTGDAETARLIQDPVELVVRALDSGRTVTDEGVFGLFLAPFVFVVVFIVATQTTSGYLMSGIVEEKSNRIMEILVTSITPTQLLLGKIIGLGALGLLQLLVWIGVGALVITLTGGSGILSGVSIPADLVLLALVYFLFDYFLFSSIMAGIGAAVGSEQESRQIAGLLGIVTAVPFFALTTFFEDPNGPIPVFLTLFPLTSPLVVILRSAFTAIPAWQIIVSIAILIVTSAAVVWISARVFRLTLLMYGKRPDLKTILQAMRSGAGMQTTATGEAAG